MLAAYAERLGLPDPFDGLVVGERPEPEPGPEWEVVEVKAAALNLHDLWTLRGFTVVPVDPPVTLGCDGAGVTADGREVVIYPVLGLGRDFHMLTDGVDGTFAARVAVPSTHLVPKPDGMAWEEVACLPTAWLTAWSMLFSRARLKPGERVLVQGASGGLSNAAIMLAAAAGAHVTATSRDGGTLERARALGAHMTVTSCEPLDDPVDVVIDCVGAATFSHSVRSLGYGGRLVVLGATTGAEATADVRAIFRNELEILGHKMGTLADFEKLCRFVAHAGLRPPIAKRYDGVGAVPDAMHNLAAGGFFGKHVIRIA